MRPGVRVDVALALLLDPIVTDGAGCVERLGDVLVGQLRDEAGRDRVAGPHAGEAVGLQLRLHRAAARALLRRAVAQQAEQVLDVMAVLVRHDVRLGETAALGAELRLQLVEEAEIQVHQLVRRTVERTDFRACRAARSGGHAVVEDRVRTHVLLAAVGELLVPVRLDGVDIADDATALGLVGILTGLA